MLAVSVTIPVLVLTGGHLTAAVLYGLTGLNGLATGMCQALAGSLASMYRGTLRADEHELPSMSCHAMPYSSPVFIPRPGSSAPDFARCHSVTVGDRRELEVL